MNTHDIGPSSSRADDLDSLKTVDWEGKLYLIEAAKAANIQRFIFFSAQNVEQFTNIPLMKLKYNIEQKLKESEVP
jgi:nucleoside-diphosphate-sugar epimerase